MPTALASHSLVHSDCLSRLLGMSFRSSVLASAASPCRHSHGRSPVVEGKVFSTFMNSTAAGGLCSWIFVDLLITHSFFGGQGWCLELLRVGVCGCGQGAPHTRVGCRGWDRAGPGLPCTTVQAAYCILLGDLVI